MIIEQYRHTEFSSVVLGAAAADVPIPPPHSLLGLGTKVTDSIHADALELRAPMANGGNVFVHLERAALNTDLIIRPGEAVDISGASKKTLSAFSSVAGDRLEVIAKYR